MCAAKSTQRPGHQADQFATTDWSQVLTAGDGAADSANQALARLCETYWYPLYAYVRRRVPDVHDAQDLTQAFFEWLLEKRPLESADPECGRFRAFLLTACRRFLINEWHKGRAAMRGGGRRCLSLDFESGESKFSLVAADQRTPEMLYERDWALTLLEQVLQQLRTEYADKQRLAQFEALKPFLAGFPSTTGYEEVARSLGISEGAVKVAAHRLRKRYRELLRSEIGQTVVRPDEIDEEIQRLFTVLGAPQ